MWTLQVGTIDCQQSTVTGGWGDHICTYCTAARKDLQKCLVSPASLRCLNTEKEFIQSALQSSKTTTKHEILKEAYLHKKATYNPLFSLSNFDVTRQVVHDILHAEKLGVFKHLCAYVFEKITPSTFQVVDTYFCSLLRFKLLSKRYEVLYNKFNCRKLKFSAYASWNGCNNLYFRV